MLAVHFPFTGDEWLHYFSERLSTLRGYEPRSFGEEKFRELLGTILECSFCIPRVEDSRQIYYRARRWNSAEGFAQLGDCFNPPGGSPGYGRANVPNDTVLYASSNYSAALDEVEARAGDFFQVIGFNVLPGKTVPLACIGELTRLRGCGRSFFGKEVEDEVQGLTGPSSAIDRTAYVDAYLAELFSSRSGRASEYRLSAEVAKHYFDQEMGILYPGVRMPHTMNLALRRGLFDRSCQVLGAETIEITNYFGYSTYSVQFHRIAVGFAPDGAIHWAEDLAANRVQHPYYHRHDPDAIGWRPGRTDKDAGTTQADRR